MVLHRFPSFFAFSIYLIQYALAQTATAPSSGNGSSGNPYQIATLDNLYWITQNNTEWGKYYIQTANIDASSSSGWDSGNGYFPIGNNAISFTGSYDGAGYTISGLTISRAATDYVGFIGFASDATIKNVNVANINFSGNSAVGGIVGFVTGSGLSLIDNCSSTGSVIGTVNQIGGLIGKTQAGTTVTKCYSTVTVSSTNGNYLGGFIGHNDQSSTISNCYSRGNVSTTNGNQVGGFAGVNQSATITNCYSTGSASGGGSSVGGLVGAVASSTVNNSFWDMDASGNATSAAGTGKTTTEMKTQSTFTDASWNFSTVWEMAGSNYPRLQSNPDQALPVELVSLNATSYQSNAELKWHTAMEVNNYGFEIERTPSQTLPLAGGGQGGGWSEIGFVEGNGTTNLPKQYSFADKNLNTGKYTYRLKQIDRDGKFTYSHTVEVTINSAPKEFALLQNYPNPFNPSTTISYQLPVNSHVTLKVYDEIGREVATLVNEVKEAGHYEVQFNASNLSSGIYFYRIQSGDFVQLKKLLLIK